MDFKGAYFYLLLLSIFGVAYGLYEDQIGKFDWKINQLGKLKFSSFEPKPPSKKVFIATEENVIAALSARTGEILWRQILEKDDQGTIQLLHVDVEMITVTGSGPFTVRGWNLNSGNLLYEWSIVATNGPFKWAVHQGKLYMVNVMKSQAEVAVYNVRIGGQPASHTIAFSRISQEDPQTVLSGLILVYISSDRKELVSVALAGNMPEELLKLPYPAYSLAPVVSASDHQYVKVITRQEQLKQRTTVERLLVCVSCRRMVIVDKIGAVHPKTPIAIHSYSADQNIHIALQYYEKEEQRELIVQTRFLETGEFIADLSSPSMPLSSPLLGLEITSVSCLVRRDKSAACQLLLSTTDNAILFLQVPPGSFLWVREEALTSIVNVELIDLPVSDGEAAIEKEFNITEGPVGMFTRRISSQLSQLQHLVMTVFGLKEPSTVNGRADLVRDDFGLHKIIVAATSVGKVFGIDNLSHEIIWQFTLENVIPFNSLGKDYVPLFVQRTARHYSATFPALCTVLYKDKQTEEVVMHSFNPITGKTLVQTIRKGYKLAQAVLLPNVNEEFLKPLLLLDTAGKVHLFPPLVRQAALQVARTTFLYTADAATGTLTGYSVICGTSDQVVHVMEAMPLWEIKLAARITAIAAKNPHEKVHSQGRVLGDRSVLYKYINPNLVAVLTQIEDPLYKNVLSVYLIDVVSGAVVFSAVHKRALEPIHVVHSENWVIYSYFSDKSRRTEITAFDLYEGKTQSNTTAFSSVWNPIQPMVERQSYILPAAIETMKETITEKGITTKHILMALNSGGVLELPWVFLDPRRPLASTPDLREEGVIPYMPELPALPEAIINYNQTMLRVRGIHTSPSGLESTCLVFVYGLDIFYTRVAPSKTFDMLKEDFDYILITAVLVGLTVSAFMTKRLAARKALKQAWK